MYQLTKTKKPLWIKILIFLVLCAFVSELLRMIFRQPTLDETLMQTSQEINKQCPIVIDSTTRLDNTAVLGGMYLLYNYTILQDVDLLREDTTTYKTAMSSQIINRLKTNPKFDSFEKKGFGIAATWYDDEGVYICSLIVGPEEFK